MFGLRRNRLQRSVSALLNTKQTLHPRLPAAPKFPSSYRPPPAARDGANEHHRSPKRVHNLETTHAKHAKQQEVHRRVWKIPPQGPMKRLQDVPGSADPGGPTMIPQDQRPSGKTKDAPIGAVKTRLTGTCCWSTRPRRSFKNTL